METHTHIYFGSEDTREHRLVWQTASAPASAEKPETYEQKLEQKARDPLAPDTVVQEIEDYANKNKERGSYISSLLEARQERINANRQLQDIKDLTGEANPTWNKMRTAIATKEPLTKKGGIEAAKEFIADQYKQIRALAKRASGEPAAVKPPYNYLRQIDALRENVAKTKKLDGTLIGTDKLKDGKPDTEDSSVKKAKKDLETLKTDHQKYMSDLADLLKRATEPNLNTDAKKQREREVENSRDERREKLMKKIEELFPDTYLSPVPPLPTTLPPSPPGLPPAPSPTLSPSPSNNLPAFNAHEQIEEVISEIGKIKQLIDERLGRIPLIPVPLKPAQAKGPAVTQTAPVAPARAPAVPAPAPTQAPTTPEKLPENLEAAMKKFEKAVKDGNEADANKALEEMNGVLPPKLEDRTKLLERLNTALGSNDSKIKNKTVEFDSKSGKLVLVEKTASAVELPKGWLEQLREAIKMLKEFFDDFFKKEKEARCGDLRDMPTAKDHLEELKEKQRQLREKAKTDPKAKKELDEVTEQINRQEAAVRRMEEQKKRNEEAEQKLKPYTTDNPKSGIRTYRDQFGNLYMVGKTDTEFTASVIVEQERAFVREAWRGQRPRGYRMPVVESAYMPVPLQPTINITQIGSVIQGVKGNVTVSGDTVQAAAAHVGEVPRYPTATAEAPNARPMPPRTTPELRNMPPRNPPAAPTAPSSSVPIPTPRPTGSRPHAGH